VALFPQRAVQGARPKMLRDHTILVCCAVAMFGAGVMFGWFAPAEPAEVLIIRSLAEHVSGRVPRQIIRPSVRFKGCDWTWVGLSVVEQRCSATPPLPADQESPTPTSCVAVLRGCPFLMPPRSVNNP
jgi:hypothetical protein